jgi:hypothetical protein
VHTNLTLQSATNRTIDGLLYVWYSTILLESWKREVALDDGATCLSFVCSLPLLHIVVVVVVGGGCTVVAVVSFNKTRLAMPSVSPKLINRCLALLVIVASASVMLVAAQYDADFSGCGGFVSLSQQLAKYDTHHRASIDPPSTTTTKYTATCSCYQQ